MTLEKKIKFGLSNYETEDDCPRLKKVLQASGVIIISVSCLFPRTRTPVSNGSGCISVFRSFRRLVALGEHVIIGETFFPPSLSPSRESLTVWVTIFGY